MAKVQNPHGAGKGHVSATGDLEVLLAEERAAIALVEVHEVGIEGEEPWS